MSFGGGSGSSSIAGSTDVALNSPANNQVLGYNSGLAKWQNQASKASSKVTVGSGGDFSTLAAVFGAYPAGNVDIYIIASSLTVPTTIIVSNCKNVSITGKSPWGGSVITCTTGLIHCTGGNNDEWEITNLKILSGTGTNTDDCIVVDYPRRWSIRRVRIEGFGGNSIWFQGGIHCELIGNYIKSGDANGINGHAGIWIERSPAPELVVASTIYTRANYIGSGKQYGMLVEYAVDCIFAADLAELCDVGLRFKQCSGQLETPYTESNRGNAIEVFDSGLAMVGFFREEPVITWLNVGGADRYLARVGETWVNPGRAVIFGGTAGQEDASLAPSIRCGTGTPEGAVSGVVGSLWMRTDGGTGTVFYVKETGTGNIGWVAK